MDRVVGLFLRAYAHPKDFSFCRRRKARIDYYWYNNGRQAQIVSGTRPENARVHVCVCVCGLCVCLCVCDCAPVHDDKLAQRRNFSRKLKATGK